MDKPQKENLRVAGIILARGGSKRVPGKNIKILGDKPLIAWVIEAAKNSKLVQRIILNTDDEKIASVGKEYGAEVLFLRPAELAQDHTPDFPVFEHCLNWLKENENYQPDLIVHLRPTGPLVTADEIDKAIETLLRYPEADSIRSVREADKSPFKMWKNIGNFMEPLISLLNIKDAHTAPSQLLPKVYQTTPDIGIFRLKTLLDKKSIIGDKVLPYYLNRPTIDIDTPIDFEIAELLIKNKNFNNFDHK